MLFALLLAEEGPKTDLAWLLYVALAFFFLMVLIGWLVSRREQTMSPALSEATASTAAHADHPSPADDLKIIEGIGPKVEKILHEAGIRTFQDLANASPDQVDAILRAAGLQMMSSAGWIEQAQLAARGDMEGLRKLQDELKGGRRV